MKRVLQRKGAQAEGAWSSSGRDGVGALVTSGASTPSNSTYLQELATYVRELASALPPYIRLHEVDGRVIFEERDDAGRAVNLMFFLMLMEDAFFSYSVDVKAEDSKLVLQIKFTLAAAFLMQRHDGN